MESKAFQILSFLLITYSTFMCGYKYHEYKIKNKD